MPTKEPVTTDITIDPDIPQVSKKKKKTKKRVKTDDDGLQSITPSPPQHDVVNDKWEEPREVIRAIWEEDTTREAVKTELQVEEDDIVRHKTSGDVAIIQKSPIIPPQRTEYDEPDLLLFADEERHEDFLANNTTHKAKQKSTIQQDELSSRLFDTGLDESTLDPAFRPTYAPRRSDVPRSLSPPASPPASINIDRRESQFKGPASRINIGRRDVQLGSPPTRQNIGEASPQQMTIGRREPRAGSPHRASIIRRESRSDSPSAQSNIGRRPARPDSPSARLNAGKRESHPESPSARFNIGRRESRPIRPGKSLSYASELPPRYIRFDSFSSAGDLAAGTRASDVLLVAMHGALDVYRILPDRMEVVARLEGLKGMVLDAKILPAVGLDAYSDCRPLVALLLHGPTDDQDSWIKYHTTLEVYSLRTQQHIQTLYTSLATTSSQAVPDLIPESTGNFKIDACGSFITLSSGTSGEIFVFQIDKCVGKFWTALRDDTPLYTLGQRWLVIVCPDSSSSISVQGTPVTSAVGVASYNAPLQPTITTDVHGLDQEGVVSRVSRQAAQELLKASRKGIELGWSGWKEFTNPSPPSRHVESEFPPTHAPLDEKRPDLPAVLSIIDLHEVKTIATFALDGCSFLSLSEDGLKLVTTSRTGEASDIWDLTHAIHEPAHVRCIQRISRNSPSVVVGASWSQDSLALQTSHGTVHLHNIAEQRQKPPKSIATLGISQGMSPPSNGFLSSIWQRPEISLTGLSETASAARAVGGRMLARGLAQGYSLAKTGVHEVWHADDNKIRTEGTAIRWIRGGIAVASTSKVCLYSVARVSRDRVTLKVEKGRRDFALPNVSIVAPDCPTIPHGFWSLKAVSKAALVPEQDEMETNPSYCPFHIDRKVSLLVRAKSDEEVDWCFGNSLGPTLKINSDEHEDDLLDDVVEQSVFRLGDT